jgi:hypothetical protein
MTTKTTTQWMTRTIMERRLGSEATCWPQQFTSMEEMFNWCSTPFIPQAAAGPRRRWELMDLWGP